MSGTFGGQATAQAVPPPGQAPLPAPGAAALLRRNGQDLERRGRPALRFGPTSFTQAEFFSECCRWANLFLARRPQKGPFHIGVLMDNVPDYLFALGGAALAGATVVGVNQTRRGEHLAADLALTDVGLLITEAGHQGRLEPVADQLGDMEILVSRRWSEGELRLGQSLEQALSEVEERDAGIEPGSDTWWALIFTSDTSPAFCTSPGVPATGSGWTARTSRLLPSRSSSGATPQWRSVPSTVCPTSMLGTR